MRKNILLLSVLLTFPIVTFGQAVSGGKSQVAMPDNAMEQVVKRILIWKFKPRKELTTIYLYEKGIERSWLPSIKNINFQLATRDHPKEVYFFKEPERNGKVFTIGFGFGDPSCGGGGNNWSFRLSRRKVRLWKSDSGFGMGCGRSIEVAGLYTRNRFYSDNESLNHHFIEKKDFELIMNSFR
jgi:hypothetical protein